MLLTFPIVFSGQIPVSQLQNYAASWHKFDLSNNIMIHFDTIYGYAKK